MGVSEIGSSVNTLAVQQQQHLEEVPEQGVPEVKDVFCPDFEFKTAEQAEHDSAQQHARDQHVQK